MGGFFPGEFFRVFVEVFGNFFSFGWVFKKVLHGFFELVGGFNKKGFVLSDFLVGRDV